MQILELFGGIGAPRKALINLGIQHKSIDYVEIDEKAVRSYNEMFEHYHKPQSVVGYNLRPDILFHGSPCQDFSRAGIRLGGNDEDKTRSSLMFETVRIIENLGKWKPKIVIWENVRGVLDKDMVHSFNNYLDMLEELGYLNSYEVLNSMDFGIPQNRNRIFVVSTLKGHFNFELLRTREMKPIHNFLESDVHEKYTIKSPSMLSRIEGGNPGTKYNGTLKIIDKFVWTITTKQDRAPNAGIVDLGNNNYRLLTERECWRLQGFTDDDYDNAELAHPSKEKFKNTTLYHQAGNSITVQVCEAIFEALISQELLEVQCDSRN